MNLTAVFWYRFGAMVQVWRNRVIEERGEHLFMFVSHLQL